MNERQYLEAIKNLPCALCSAYPPSSAHHLRDGMGIAQKNSDYLTIPLCYDCHQGKNGLHGDRALFNIHKENELSLLAKTIKRMMRDNGF